MPPKKSRPRPAKTRDAPVDGAIEGSTAGPGDGAGDQPPVSHEAARALLVGHLNAMAEIVSAGPLRNLFVRLEQTVESQDARRAVHAIAELAEVGWHCQDVEANRRMTDELRRAFSGHRVPVEAIEAFHTFSDADPLAGQHRSLQFAFALARLKEFSLTGDLTLLDECAKALFRFMWIR